MREIRKTMKLSKIEYFETHYALMNAILPKKMTPTEIKVIANFMSLEGHVLQFRFGPSARKIVMQRLGMSHGGLGNHLGSLIEKGFLNRGVDNVLEILPILIPEDAEQLYTFKIVNMGGDE